MHPISKILCETYNELHRRGQVAFSLHKENREKIDSSVKTVNSKFFGVYRYPEPKDKAVAYLYFLIKNHPVTDGNKRLAALWFTVYCVVQDLKPDYSDFTLDQIVVAVEASASDEKDEIIDSLKDLLFHSYH